MKNNNIEGILNGVSNVLEKLSDLAEKGQKLKQAVHEINTQSTRTGTTYSNAIQELPTTLEETPTDWIIRAEVIGAMLNQVQLDAVQQKLQIKIIQGQQLLYKEIELPGTCHIQNIQLHCDSGQLQINCPK
jgi:HSP20 family molecular chaperone IbpA